MKQKRMSICGICYKYGKKMSVDMHTYDILYAKKYQQKILG